MVTMQANLTIDIQLEIRFCNSLDLNSPNRFSESAKKPALPAKEKVFASRGFEVGHFTGELNAWSGYIYIFIYIFFG